MNKVVSNHGEKSELEKFASFFHQDFTLMFHGMLQGIEEYTEKLSADQKQALVQQLKTLLSEYSGNDNKGLIKAWFRLGAEWGERKILRENLLNTIERLEK